MQFLLKAFLLFFLIIAVSTNVIGQIQLKLNAESGAYIDLNSSYSRNVEFMNKFLGSAEFIEQSGKNIYKLGLKLRPQFFNAELHSIKYRLDGTYAFKSEDLEWRAGLSYTNYDYSYTSADYSYGIFQFINIIDLPLNSGLPVSLLFGYSRYSLEYANTINSDIFHINGLYNKKLTDYSFLSFGIFAQNFDMISRLNSGNELSSKGWKYGPQIKIQYLRSFIFNADYKFLIYSSNNTKYPSYEHNLSLLSGTIINRRISVFILAEFNFIRTSIKNDGDDNNPIFYTPTQNENEIYLKTSYKIKPGFSLYTKIGYFRENFYLDQFKLDGMSVLIGMEIKN